jgi:glyoxylase I family protein
MSTLESSGSRGAGATLPALARIDHVGLTVTDVEASEAWYGRVLGLHRLFVAPHHGGDGSSFCVVLGAQGVPLTVGLDHHPANPGHAFDARRTGLDHVCFRVATRGSLESWMAHLDREGIAHSGMTELEAMGMVFAIVNFRDPDGIALELMTDG